MSARIPAKPSPPSSSSSRRKKPRREPEALAPNPRARHPELFHSIEPPLSPPSLPLPFASPPSHLLADGFDDLERRPIFLVDGSVRCYYALPAHYPMGPATAPPRRPPPGEEEEDYWSYLGLDDHRGLPSAKRKSGEMDDQARLRESVRRYGNPSVDVSNSLGEARETSDDLARIRESLRRYGKPSVDVSDSPGGAGELRDYTRLRESVRRFGNPDAADVMHAVGKPRREEGEGGAVKEAFFRCLKLINESSAARKMYLEDGKSVPLNCIVCERSSKVFAGVHDLVMHAYAPEKPELLIDHLGLHKALCVLMGWSYVKAPDNSKAYQLLPTNEATANREDLIVWPPTVIIHNTHKGRKKDGRMDGMSDKEVEMKLKEIGFRGGTSKSLYGKGGHLGITAVKFASSPTGLKEADSLAEYFKKENRGREGWAQVEASQNRSNENSSAAVKMDRKIVEKNNQFYGYLATAFDLDRVDVDTRKRAVIKSRRELHLSN